MADQESIDTFIGITGSSQLVAIRKLAEHGGGLNEAVNSYFTQGDTDIRHETNVPALHEDFMDINGTHRGFHDSQHPETASRNDLVTNSFPEIVPMSQVTRNHRLGTESSSVQDAEEQPLVRRSSRLRKLSSPSQQHPDEWGGISSEEHDEAVAAIFGGVPEGAGHRVPYVRNRYRRNGVGRNNGPYTRSTPRSPSPTLTAQRLIREQQNEEYLASLQADREKELLEQAARKAAMEEEQRKLEQELEIERQVAAKESSLPQEPASADDNAVALLVRMPDGSRHGRRFMKTDKLQYLFDFIDVGRVVKPSTYRLVRPYPRCAFSDGERDLTLNELGLTSKHEALFLELI